MVQNPKNHQRGDQNRREGANFECKSALWSPFQRKVDFTPTTIKQWYFLDLFAALSIKMVRTLYQLLKYTIFLSGRFQNFSNIDKQRFEIRSGRWEKFSRIKKRLPPSIWNPRLVYWHPHQVDSGITGVLRSNHFCMYAFLSARLKWGKRTHKGIGFLATAISWTLASLFLFTLLWKAFLNILSLALLIDSHLPFP